MANKTANCPLCGSTANTKCFSDKTYNVLGCNECDLFFIDPYGADVHKKVSTYDYDDLKIIDPARHHASSMPYYKNKYFSYIEKECAGAESLLDVGCGTGVLLELLHERFPGLQRVGIELNTQRAAYAKRIAQCEIHQVPIEDFAYDGRFDVITLINVLSHIPSLDSLFRAVHHLIAAEGKLVLKVGEMTKDVKKDAVFDWGIPDHLHFLGMHTIDFICKKYGFKVVRHDRQPLSTDLFARSAWTTRGRSNARNLVKRVIFWTPFGLSMLRRLYDRRHANTIYSSFIVLSPAGD